MFRESTRSELVRCRLCRCHLQTLLNLLSTSGLLSLPATKFTSLIAPPPLFQYGPEAIFGSPCQAAANWYCHPPKSCSVQNPNINSLNASLYTRSNLHRTIHQAASISMLTTPSFARGSLNPPTDISPRIVYLNGSPRRCLVRSTRPYSRQS